MPTEYSISENLHYTLQRFLNDHDIALLNQNLRRLLIDFLDYELRTGVPLYLDGFLFPLNGLLDVLDIAGKELQQHAINEHKEWQPLTTKEKIIAFLTASLSPAALFLLYHHAPENSKQYFDFLAVIPPASKTSFAYYEQVITMANIDDAIINVSLHKEDVIQQQLKDGHIYYSMACNKENFVYGHDAFELPGPNKEALKAHIEKATAEFNTAHKKADSFLNGAADFWVQAEKEMSAFMLQQAIELTIRGLIMALLGSCIKTHCFAELKKPLKRCAPEIAYLISADAVEETRLLTLLEKAYLESRYSSQLVISGNDIDMLTESAEALHEKASDIFSKRISIISKNSV